MIDQNLVLFESNPDFADNSRALYDYIVDKTDFKTFWVVKDPAMLGPMRAAGVDCDIENSRYCYGAMCSLSGYVQLYVCVQ